MGERTTRKSAPFAHLLSDRRIRRCAPWNGQADPGVIARDDDRGDDRHDERRLNGESQQQSPSAHAIAVSGDPAAMSATAPTRVPPGRNVDVARAEGERDDDG